jgi:hypothetical protein
MHQMRVAGYHVTIFFLFIAAKENSHINVGEKQVREKSLHKSIGFAIKATLSRQLMAMSTVENIRSMLPPIGYFNSLVVLFNASRVYKLDLMIE